MSSTDRLKNSISKLKPFVSICTPTYNRRPFISSMIKCFKHQDYPKDKMEWIIIDDGTDKIEDLVKGIKQVKYFKYDEKMTLGKKRNLMHEKSKGSILIYMDDDDYYPPNRVSHAVEMLMSHPDYSCAGCSELYLYFKHVQKMYQFGPYFANHATAATFAFKRKLLEDNKYEDEACLAEEKHFLKNYTVPMLQLDPLKTILVFSHNQNTFDKKKLLDKPSPFIKESNKTVDMFIKNPELKKFYMETIEELLENYEPGKPTMKPDVLLQTLKMEELKNKELEEKLKNNRFITIQQNDQITHLNPEEIVSLLKHLQSTVITQTKELEKLKNNTFISININDELTNLNPDQVLNLLKELQNTINKKNEEIQELNIKIKNFENDTQRENTILDMSSNNITQ